MKKLLYLLRFASVGAFILMIGSLGGYEKGIATFGQAMHNAVFWLLLLVTTVVCQLLIEEKNSHSKE